MGMAAPASRCPGAVRRRSSSFSRALERGKERHGIDVLGQSIVTIDLPSNAHDGTDPHAYSTWPGPDGTAGFHSAAHERADALIDHGARHLPPERQLRLG